MSAMASRLLVNDENPASRAKDWSEPVPASSAKRRALGDVMNIAISGRQLGVTPKGANGAKTVHTPACTPTLAPRSLAYKTPWSVGRELPPVEKLPPVPEDTFDDIFGEDDRLSEIFISDHQSVKFVARLPCATLTEQKTIRLDNYDVLSDLEAQRHLKKRTKSFKRLGSSNAFSIFQDTAPDLPPVLELNEMDVEILSL